ncbi:hypothetical protein ABVB18_00190 [Xanthomonas citri pv. mangiferaeindicae]|nr:hypothetical protein [Xanthomonas citri]
MSKILHTAAAVCALGAADQWHAAVAAAHGSDVASIAIQVLPAL